MKVAKYEFVEGARFQAGAKGDADVIGKHIEALRKKGKGELTPQDIVADARSSKSPLHGYFEWDDSKAAEQYRLKQARGLIRSVVAVYVSDDKPAVRTKAFVHVAEAGAPHYRATDEALSRGHTREIVLRRAWAELRAWRQRYTDMEELSLIFAVVDAEEKRQPPAAAEAKAA